LIWKIQVEGFTPSPGEKSKKLYAGNRILTHLYAVAAAIGEAGDNQLGISSNRMCSRWMEPAPPCGESSRTRVRKVHEKKGAERLLVVVVAAERSDRGSGGGGGGIGVGEQSRSDPTACSVEGVFQAI
jgi:hypothetical protein